MKIFRSFLITVSVEHSYIRRIYVVIYTVKETYMYVIASFVLHCHIMLRRHKKGKNIWNGRVFFKGEAPGRNNGYNEADVVRLPCLGTRNILRLPFSFLYNEITVCEYSGLLATTRVFQYFMNLILEIHRAIALLSSGLNLRRTWRTTSRQLHTRNWWHFVE